jgi:hypothetical protein
VSKNLQIVAIVAALLGASYFGYQHYAATPTYSLVQIKLALDNRDVAGFEHHVDVDSMVSRAVDNLMAEQLAEAAQGAGEEFGRALGYGLLEMMKPMMVAAVRKELHRSIESGEVDFADLSIDAQGPLATHFVAAMQNLGIRDDSGNGFEIRRNGRMATLYLHAQPRELDQPVLLEFAMRDMGGYWRVVEFSNVGDLIAQFESSPGLEGWTPPVRR